MGEKFGKRSVELRRSFDIRQMRGGQFDIAGARDSIGQKTAVDGRRRDIVRSGDNERGDGSGDHGERLPSGVR